MKIMYYMPLFLKKKALESGDQDVLDFCDLFKVVNSNASIIDRTGTLECPFPVHVEYPIPEVVAQPPNFAEQCVTRAAEILNEGKPVVCMYSGGLDSSCVMLAFYLAIKRGVGSFDQVTVSCTTESIRENPEMWYSLILPYFHISSAHAVLREYSPEIRYVQGENADQMFGSDRVFTRPDLLTADYSLEVLSEYLMSLKLRPTAFTKYMDLLPVLASKCPLPVTTMVDFFWWLNFSCKWQSVALRTLAFTDVFKDDNSVSLSELETYNSFFNTVGFQQLSMSEVLEKWGTVKSRRSYKASARKFLSDSGFMPEYCETKIKVGSLYALITQKTYTANAFGLAADGRIRAADLLI